MTTMTSSQSLATLMKQLPSLPFSAELRQVRQYSNMAYIIASEVVTRLSGMPFTTFVQSRILTVLGMEATTYEPDETRVMGSVQGSDHCTQFYDWDLKLHQVNNAGMGGIWTTGHDMVRPC
jgi:CubicO group peptidase (beta-lactamase class C family)